jgi:DHA1 family bicyclomycin/chloramphenicol resistance-like MFS transporter
LGVDAAAAGKPRIASGAEQVAPRGLLVLLMAMTAIGPTTLNILVPALPELARVVGADIATLQLTVSLYLVGLAGAQLVMGPLSDRFGRRPVLLAGFALTVVASTAAIFAASIASLILARGAIARRLDRPDHRPRHHSATFATASTQPP